MASIAYLGPAGTFTEGALLQMTDAGMVPQRGGVDWQLLPVDSTTAALDAVRDGAAEFACVPIENSIDGSIMPTLDSLRSEEHTSELPVTAYHRVCRGFIFR